MIAPTAAIRLNAHPTTDSPLLNTALLDQAQHTGQPLLPLLRRALREADAALRQRFENGVSVESLVHERAAFVDQLIGRAFDLHLAASKSVLTLAAVGGYGRGELHPHSDVDLLILLPSDERERCHHAIGQFVAFLWDLGLQVGHSVRSPEECLEEARADVTVVTNLMEARLLAGNAALFESMRAATSSGQLWPAWEFFLAKHAEQQRRHARYHDTAYRLEPDLKEGPGGLRDIQTIAWVAQRHFGTASLHALVSQGFLTADELRTLQEGQVFLWRLRFALHLLHGRREDRLLFDSQIKLARQLGYRDQPGSLAVEQLMQAYYRTVKQLSLLNEMLLQLLEEAVCGTARAEAEPLTADFEIRNGFLHARDPALFAHRPAALLEVFHVLQQHPRLKGVSAVTIRGVRANLERVNEPFRAEAENRALFMAILRGSQGVTHELRRMNRYGVLGRYLPAFGAIVGRMQYDLFHAYTVDEHILFVVSNLRRLALERYNHELPECSRIMQALPKPELAYLAALFHDIAKGRGGDHSELGSSEAETFCLDHGLSRYDARLVSWLVQHHLLLSLTAQKKDIHDPNVVHEFALTVGDQLHLDYLYLLTVADVRGTNPELWNSWKASLFAELYRRASETLRRGLENPLDKDELIRETQQQALALLLERQADEAAVYVTWRAFSEEYFLRHSPDEIAWHTQQLAGRFNPEALLVFLRQETQRGGTQVCVFSSRDEFVFSRVTAALAQLGLTILDARLVPVGGDQRLDTYTVLEDNGAAIADPERLAEIERVLRREVLRISAAPLKVMRHVPRQVRMFTTPTRIQFADDAVNRRTVLEITAADRPGLLSLIGQTLRSCEVRLQNAKITTVGERAEDVFFITDARHHPLTDPAARERLHQALLAQIGERG